MNTIRLRLFVLFCLLIGLGIPIMAQSTTERTRLLLIVDCSNSMWDHWQSASKIKVTQQVLTTFIDSVSNQNDIEVALRVFGHLNKGQIGTRLEVPFAKDNTYRLQSKLKTLVPNGGCTAATALSDAISDFPTDGHGRNLILIITDGMEGLREEICDVARQVQLSGVVVQTFVMGIADGTFDFANCAGHLFPVAHEEVFAPTLFNIFRLAGKQAQVVLRLTDSHGNLFETEHPIAFYDHRTGVVRQSSIYSTDEHLQPDTLRLDPLVVYDLTLFTHPPIYRRSLQFGIDTVSTLTIPVPEGTLRARFVGGRPLVQSHECEVVVRKVGADRVAAQTTGEEGQYMVGYYDVEVQTLPTTTFHNVEVRENATTDLSIPMPGIVQLSKPKGIHNGVILRIDEGMAEFATDLNPSTAAERLQLQPGEYEVVLHPQGSNHYNQVQSRRFVVASGQTTKVDFQTTINRSIPDTRRGQR